MALELKVLVQLDIQGESVWVTNKTGAYAVDTNEGGFGNTGVPNPDLADSALAVVIVKNETTAKNLSAVSIDVLYDNAATNADETTFEFTYDTDGWHSITLFRLPVSNDGAIDLDGNAVNDGDYFFYTGTSKVSTKVAGVVTEVTDYSVMVGDADVVQETCERLLLAKLAIEKKEIYNDYKTARDTKGECRETENLFRKLLDITFDMQGAFSAFWSGLMVQAEDIVVSLLKKHKLN